MKWEDPKVDYTQSDLLISRTTSNYVFTPKKFFKWEKSRRNNATIEHKQGNGITIKDTSQTFRTKVYLYWCMKD